MYQSIFVQYILKERMKIMNKIICIGREYGSGGREIGEKLARQLGIPCYDKLLIKKAALESGLSEEFLSRTEESPINSIQFLSGNPYADVAGIGTAFYSESQMAYNAERTVIEQLAKQGPCVIIGRCASAILPKEDRLSVFIYADKADKLKRVMVRNNLTEKEAAHRIKHMDRMRKQFFDFYSDTSWGHTDSYDLLLSSSRFGTDGCVNMIVNSIKEWEA